MLWKTLLLAAAAAFALPVAESVVLCYYESWAIYRMGEGKVTVDDLDPFACTHYLYAFAGLNNDHTIKVGDPWADLCNGGGHCGYKKFTDMKAQNNNLLTLLSVGGWSVGSPPFSLMTATPATRAAFITSAINLLRTHNFDGLDVSWLYPALNGGAPQDRDNFVHLLRELEEAMTSHGMMVTVSVAPTEEIASKAYDIPGISQYVHFVSVMTYNFHGPWDPYTHHHSALYPFIEDTGNNFYFNMNEAIRYWLMNGMPAQKMVLGMPMFGRCWSLNTVTDTGYYAPASAPPSPPGPWTLQWGFMSYAEICKAQKEYGWTIAKEAGCNEPYTYHLPSNRIWCSYEDRDSVAIKAKYAAGEGLAGLMVWSINDDDAHGFCSGRKFDLTLTLLDAFNAASQ
ncbi:acidic mammalian chitinase-like [Portunus trituberculatus]|uniref:acidic mammalian chitinase-like n=1 Tax=Portunus trituberculatus TaxID=210409 RepID=UPI001E1D0581|nr:acidic mammalian chitinase-like [Portunus trituberculatus]